MTSIYILIIIAAASIFYKLYLQIKIQYVERRLTFLTFCLTLSFMSFIPIYWSFKNNNAQILAKRANKALYLFYAIFIIINILSLLVVQKN